MDGIVQSGARVSHSRYGNGRILGVSTVKKAIRVEFDRIGIKQLNYPCPELQGCGGNSPATTTAQCAMHFEATQGSKPGCRWVIEHGGPPLATLVGEIKCWTSSKVQTGEAVIDLKPVSKEKMVMKISGYGRDGRCRWCRTFRSGLRTAVRREYGREAFITDGGCIFESVAGRSPREVIN